jgi:hypothetical protein
VTQVYECCKNLAELASFTANPTNWTKPASRGLVQWGVWWIWWPRGNTAVSSKTCSRMKCWGLRPRAALREFDAWHDHLGGSHDLSVLPETPLENGDQTAVLTSQDYCGKHVDTESATQEMLHTCGLVVSWVWTSKAFLSVYSRNQAM